MTSAQAGERIEHLIAHDKWKGARALIRKELHKKPDDHWLLARLALTYYEERDYSSALRYAQKAHERVPDCPLALWELAGAQDMLGKTSDAIATYTQLVSLPHDPALIETCAEGVDQLLSRKVDAVFRIALCEKDRGRPDVALKLLRVYLKCLESGVATLYGADEAIREMTEITNASPQKSDLPRKMARVRKLLAI